MGEVDPSRLTVRQSYPDPRQLRHRLNMTQEEFSRAFGLNIWTLRDWEQHNAEPEGPARTLLRVIAQNPEVVRRAVAAAMRWACRKPGQHPPWRLARRVRDRRDCACDDRAEGWKS